MSMLKKGDEVFMKGSEGVNGAIVRTAKDGAWADVLWQHPTMGSWKKRQPDASLLILKVSK